MPVARRTDPLVRRLSRSLTLCAAGLLGSCGDANEAANRAFVDLARETAQASVEPEDVRKYDQLNDVQAKVAKLLASYPQSNVAVRIAADEKIGPLSPSAIQGELAELSAKPAICRLHLSSRCLAALSAATYAKLDDQLKAILRPSFQAIAIRDGSSASAVPPSPKSQETRADNITVGFFLADEARRDPGRYWTVVDDYLGQRFASKGGAHFIAFGWTINQLLGGVPTLEDLRVAEQLVEAAPANERDSLKTSLRFDRNNAIPLIPPAALTAIFDQLHGDELSALSQTQMDSLPDQMVARAPAKAILQMRRAVPIALLTQAVDREQDAAAKREDIRLLLLRYGDELPAEQFLAYVQQLDASGRSSLLVRGILERAADDLPGAALLAPALAASESYHSIWLKTILSLAQHGFSAANVAAIKSLYTNHLLNQYEEPMLDAALASHGAIRVREAIDIFLEWLDSGSGSDAEQELATSEALSKGRKDGRPFHLSDADYAYLIESLLDRDVKNIAHYAWRIRDLRARGLGATADLIEKRVLAAPKSADGSDPRKYLAGPRMHSLIVKGDYAQAYDLTTAFNEEEQISLIEAMLRPSSDYADQPLPVPQRDQFMETVADRNTSVAHHVLARNVRNIAGDQTEIELAYRLAKTDKQRSSVDPAIFDLYMNQLYRSPDLETLKAGTFDRPNPFAFTENGYLLMKQLIGQRQ